MAEPERLLWLARRDARKWRWARKLRDAWQKAARRGAPQVSEVLRAVRVLSLKAQPDESELLLALAQSLPVPSRLDAPLRVPEPAPWAPLVPPPALPARSASPLVPKEPPAHSVSQQQARHSLAEAPRAPQASSARPWPPHPSLLFPLWQLLRRALPLRPLPESFCAPFQRRPRGSSSSASSSRLRHTRATGQ
jgi:hypothetical protein